MVQRRYGWLRPLCVFVGPRPALWLRAVAWSDCVVTFVDNHDARPAQPRKPIRLQTCIERLNAGDTNRLFGMLADGRPITITDRYSL